MSLSPPRCPFLLYINCTLTCVSAHLKSTSSAADAVFVFSMLAVSLAQVALTRRSPPEPSIYTATAGQWSVDSLSRPIHVGLLLGVLAILQHDDRHHAWAFALHIVLPLLPAAWCVGLLPPLRALVTWAVEQYTVHALGGTQAASDERLVFHALAGTAVFGVVYGLLRELDGTDALVASVTVAAIAGCILSMDVLQGCAWLRQALVRLQQHSLFLKRGNFQDGCIIYHSNVRIILFQCDFVSSSALGHVLHPQFLSVSLMLRQHRLGGPHLVRMLGHVFLVVTRTFIDLCHSLSHHLNCRYRSETPERQLCGDCLERPHSRASHQLG